MPIWSVSPVTQEPEVLLSDWQIVEIPAGTRHFVGYNQGLREGRVSSTIVEFDPATRTGITESGRVDRLVGEPGEHQDALWTWTGWMRVNSVKSFQLVTLKALHGT